MNKGPTMILAEDRYLHHMPFHAQVDIAVQTLEAESNIVFDPDDRSLATIAVAVALVQNGVY